MPEPSLPADALSAAPIFATLDAAQREDLASHASRVRVRAGDWVFRQGEAPDALYVVLSGRLEAVVESPRKVLRVLGRGAAIGELALLTGSTRSASVRARRDSELLQLTAERIEALLAAEPAFSISLTRYLATQLQASQSLDLAPSPRPETIGVLSLPAGPSARELAGMLAGLLGESRTAVLSEDDAGAPEEYAGLLDRAERENDQVLLAAEAGDGAGWRAFCLRQADRTLLVAEGPPDSAPHPLARRPDTEGRCDVLLAGSPPSGSLGAWIDALGVPAGRLIGPRAEWTRTLAPLARSLQGTSLGLALSGGGARGFTHIGVVEVLLEAGVTFDRIAGVSMGAVVGAQLAMGVDPAAIRERCQEEFVRGNPMGDYTLPVVALVRGRRAEAMVRRMFGDVLIEELPVEFMCTSCDLVTSTQHFHRRGLLIEAVGASFCLPGIGPPVAMGDRLLVDGGVMNNLPVEPLAATGEGPVIASDVTAMFEVPRRHQRVGGVAGRLRGAVLGRGIDVPLRIPEVIIRSITLGSIDTAAEGDAHANIVIRPDVSRIPLTAFDQIDALIDAGRQAARATLEAHPELAA